MITEMQKQKRRLIAQISEAFDAVPYPGDDNLYDGGQRDDDYGDVIRHLTGKHWKDLIPKRKPPKGRSNPLTHDLIFCSLVTWHFFLPAYLIIDLMRGESDTFLFELRNSTAPKFDRLSAAQCAVIVSYLEYAETLLYEKQKRRPQYSRHYEWERRRMEPVAAYWSNRLKAL